MIGKDRELVQFPCVMFLSEGKSFEKKLYLKNTFLKLISFLIT